MEKDVSGVEQLACQPTCPPKAWRRWKALRRKARAAFTLVELLVVITILGILMAMMVPAAGMIMRRAANARARADADIVVSTVLKYRMEYNRWPLLGNPDDTAVFTTDKNWVKLMSPAPSDPRTDGNFKKIIFFEGGGGSLASEGLNSGAFVDSWGNPYQFKMDTTGEGGFANPDPSPEDGEPDPIQAKVIAWSEGVDKKVGGMLAEDWEDNIKSWWK